MSQPPRTRRVEFLGSPEAAWDPAGRMNPRRVVAPARLDDDLRQLAQQKGATYVSLFDALCRGISCEKFAAPGIPLQFDDGHLTPEGSVLVAERLRVAGAFR